MEESKEKAKMVDEGMVEGKKIKKSERKGNESKKNKIK
jgi:hypothetical protein